MPRGPSRGPTPSRVAERVVLTAFISAALAIALILGLAQLIARRLGLADLLSRAELLSARPFSGPLPVRGIQAIEALLERLTAQEHRLYSTHSVTGLPTREPLAARMAADRTGTLALFSCKDYDRLCAFDPLSAEGLLRHVADRMSRMLPGSRFLAQVDRSHLAIWIGPEVEPRLAEAEIDALAYALGERVVRW